MDKIRKLWRPAARFIQTSAFGGILLVISTIIALIWANTAPESYNEFWHTHLSIELGKYISLDKSLTHWINDGVMAIFFFVVGLEIKREVLVGELKSWNKAALPILAAIGGMVVPGIFYFLWNMNGDGATGWAIPMATDIAFALGIMSLMGKKVPSSLQIFLMAVAIVDDIGAVLVIALFYTETIQWGWVLGAAVVLAISGTLGFLRFRNAIWYAVLGVILWFFVLESGIHATIAGILMAFTIPSKTKIDGGEFIAEQQEYLARFKAATIDGGRGVLTNREQRAAIYAMERSCEAAQSPLQRLEHSLHDWVSFVIMPVFALANAGVVLDGSFVEAFQSPITLGVIAGSFFGKQVGIMLAVWLGVRFLKIKKPVGVNWGQIYGVSCLAGIGFTMSFFVADLAFISDGSGGLLGMAKVGILTASILSGLFGWFMLQHFSYGKKSSQRSF